MPWGLCPHAPRLTAPPPLHSPKASSPDDPGPAVTGAVRRILQRLWSASCCQRGHMRGGGHGLPVASRGVTCNPCMRYRNSASGPAASICMCLHIAHIYVSCCCVRCGIKWFWYYERFCGFGLGPLVPHTSGGRKVLCKCSQTSTVSSTWLHAV